MSQGQKKGNVPLTVIIIVGIIFFGSRFFNKLTSGFRKSKGQTNTTQHSTNNGSTSLSNETKDSSGRYGDLRIGPEGIWPPGEIKEDGALETNLLKKNYYIVFDGSGSMEGDRLSIAKKALKEFVKSVPIEANLGLAVFDYNGLNERVSLGESRDTILSAIDLVTADGTTPLSDAIEIAYDKLIGQGHKQLGYGEYNLVVVTDGEASDGYEPTEIVDVILADSPVSVHTIGFQIGTNHSLNQPGRIFYKSADNFEELTQGLGEVLAESEEFVITSFE